MNRFFVPSENIIEDNIIIDDLEQMQHICKVLRFKISDKINIFDEKNNIYEGTIQELNNKKIIIKIIKSHKINNRENLQITLACAIPKKAKFDFIVEKATELGVSKIIPIKTKHTVVKFSDKKAEQKLKRWQKIILNTVEQSKRVNVPQIEPIKNFQDVLKLVKNYDLVLIPCLIGPRKNLKEIFNDFKGKSTLRLRSGLMVSEIEPSILIFIGPEGDFAQEEIDASIKAGCIPVSLGETVLKVDTAAIAVLSYIKLSMI